ncbi:unnamed protein product [Trichogramma brassicae]|uniref:Reverse transcriptase domain-containing protein n=1 Tax=Trichogramma brassicae TaxID=86971 RepID=A0A6H5J4H5_9HYME|nr:unnamed protein product [Trichogramma brassicae]
MLRFQPAHRRDGNEAHGRHYQCMRRVYGQVNVDDAVVSAVYWWTSETADLRRSCLRALRLAQKARCRSNEGASQASYASTRRLLRADIKTMRRIVAALFPNLLVCLTSQLCNHHSRQEQLYQPSPWKNYEEHAGGSRITLRVGRTEYQTPPSRSPLPRTRTSSCRCTWHACGPVSFQRARKAEACPAAKARQAPRRTIVVQAALYAEYRGRDSRKKSSATTSKATTESPGGASQITSTAFGRGDRRSTPSRTSTPPPERPSRGKDGPAAPRSTAPCYLSARKLDYDTDDGPESYRVTAGVPQGSVLGLILWERHVRRPFCTSSTSEANVKIVGFAYDIALVTVAKHLWQIENDLSSASSSGRAHISYDATYVIAGVPPLALLADEHARIYQRLSEDVKEKERRETLGKWQDRLDWASKGRWTHRLIPNIAEWVERGHGEVNYYLTQLLSGHGYFKSHSQRYDNTLSALCPACPTKRGRDFNKSSKKKSSLKTSPGSCSRPQAIRWRGGSVLRAISRH